MGKYRMRRIKRRKKLSYSRVKPVVITICIIMGIIFAIGATIHFGIPFINDLSKPKETPSPEPTETIASTAIPQPTQIPSIMDDFDALSSSHEIVPQVEDASEYRWFGDPYHYNGTILFTGGKLIDNVSVMCTLFMYSTDDDRTTRVFEHELIGDHFMFAQMNDKYIVFLDAYMDGGGYITCYDRQNKNAEPEIVKQVYVGQPEIKLWDNYLVWTERTGTRMDKLYVCDLDTMESITLVMFSDSVYGQSLPSIMDGMIVWANAEHVGDIAEATSIINYLSLESGSQYSYETGTYVHDPEGNGKYFAWLDTHHDEEAKLYGSRGSDDPVLIAEGVIEFGLYEDYIVYSKDQAIWLYSFEADRHFRLTSSDTAAQFMGISDGIVFWMDVTQRGNDILMYLELPIETESAFAQAGK